MLDSIIYAMLYSGYHRKCYMHRMWSPFSSGTCEASEQEPCRCRVFAVRTRLRDGMRSIGATIMPVRGLALSWSGPPIRVGNSVTVERNSCDSHNTTIEADTHFSSHSWKTFRYPLPPRSWAKSGLVLPPTSLQDTK